MSAVTIVLNSPVARPFVSPWNEARKNAVPATSFTTVASTSPAAALIFLPPAAARIEVSTASESSMFRATAEVGKRDCGVGNERGV